MCFAEKRCLNWKGTKDFVLAFTYQRNSFIQCISVNIFLALCFENPEKILLNLLVNKMFYWFTIWKRLFIYTLPTSDFNGKKARSHLCQVLIFITSEVQSLEKFDEKHRRIEKNSTRKMSININRLLACMSKHWHGLAPHTLTAWII